jgi:hypothetical protein
MNKAVTIKNEPERDAAALIALILAIYGGDPAPHGEISASVAESAAAHAIEKLSLALTGEARHAVQKAVSPIVARGHLRIASAATVHDHLEAMGVKAVEHAADHAHAETKVTAGNQLRLCYCYAIKGLSYCVCITHDVRPHTEQ